MFDQGVKVSNQVSCCCLQTRRFSGKIKSTIKSIINAPTIRRVGDPLLREEAKPVEMGFLSTPQFTEITEKMVTAMRKEEAYGISAPLLGHSLQVIAYEYTGHHMKRCMQIYGSCGVSAMEMRICPLTILINPTIEIIDPQVVAYKETCLSMPGFSALVPRCKAVKVKALSMNGIQLDFEASGWIARIIQQHMDILRGNLLIDSMLYKSLVNEDWRNYRKY